MPSDSADFSRTRELVFTFPRLVLTLLLVTSLLFCEIIFGEMIFLDYFRLGEGEEETRDGDLMLYRSLNSVSTVLDWSWIAVIAVLSFLMQVPSEPIRLCLAACICLHLMQYQKTPLEGSPIKSSKRPGRPMNLAWITRSHRPQLIRESLRLLDIQVLAPQLIVNKKGAVDDRTLRLLIKRNN